METQTQNTVIKNAFRRRSKLLLTACIMVSISAGWLLGNLTTNAFSQSVTKNADRDNSIHLPSFSVNGETLPTIMLTEFSVIAKNK